MLKLLSLFNYIISKIFQFKHGVNIMYIKTELVSNFFFLEIGHPKLRVELRRALKTGVRDLTLAPGRRLFILLREEWLRVLPFF